ncbi:MAG: hypothetical protein U0Z44_01270 [Kouleothrix sp.]
MAHWFGAGVAALKPSAFAYGADKAYVVDDPALAQYTDGFVGAAVWRYLSATAGADRRDLQDA